jgi:hypothetical protein
MLQQLTTVTYGQPGMLGNQGQLQRQEIIPVL